MYYLYRLKPSAAHVAALSCCLLLMVGSLAFSLQTSYFAPSSCSKLCPNRAVDLRLFSKVIPSGEDLAGLSRKELQQLAKDNGVKANMKNAEIIASLTALQNTSPKFENTMKAKTIPALVKEKAKLATEAKTLQTSTTSTTPRKKTEVASLKATKKTDIEAGSVIASVLEEQGISMTDLEQLRSELLSEVSSRTSERALKNRVDEPSIIAEAGRGKSKRGSDPKMATKNTIVANSKKEAASSIATTEGKPQKQTTIDPVVPMRKYAVSYSQKTPPSLPTYTPSTPPSPRVHINSAASPSTPVAPPGRVSTPPPAAKTSGKVTYNDWSPGVIVNKDFFSTSVKANGVSKQKSATTASTKTNLNGVTLKAMLEFLVEEVGFDGLHQITKLRCFDAQASPSLSSGLKLLRQEDMKWAREKLEGIYVAYGGGGSTNTNTQRLRDDSIIMRRKYY